MENNELDKIRHFKGSVQDFKNYFNKRANENINDPNQSRFVGDDAFESVSLRESKEETGLMIKGRTRSDNQKIDDILDDLDLYAEWDAKEGYFFLPEEEDMFDELEMMIQKEFDKRNVNAHFEGVFESLNKSTITKSKINTNGDYSDNMSYGQLESCIDNANMIRERIEQGASLDPWMHSQITIAKNELTSVFDALDGDDGVIESNTHNKIPTFKKFN